VSLAVNHGDDGQDDIQARGPLGSLGDPQGDAGGTYLSLGPHNPLRDRRFRGQGGTCDLRGREAADRTERQSELRVRGDSGVTAAEQEGQSLVGPAGADERCGLSRIGEQGQLLAVPLLAPPAVKGVIAGRLR
jgi:hypothetical protein